MEACENRVESLKKISVTVEADDDPQHPEATLKPASFDFIFGIDSQGLCDFERALAERHPGERVRYMLQSSRCQQDCRHLTPLLRVQLHPIRGPLFWAQLRHDLPTGRSCARRGGGGYYWAL